MAPPRSGDEGAVVSLIDAVVQLLLQPFKLLRDDDDDGPTRKIAFLLLLRCVRRRASCW